MYVLNMMKSFSINGIKNFISVTTNCSVRRVQKPLCDKKHAVTTSVENLVCGIPCDGGLYQSSPNNRMVVYGHRHGDLTKFHIRFFSTESASPDRCTDMTWEESVDYSRLSPLEREIHKRHKEAVMEKQFFYIDPCTGYQVMSRYAHLKRGDCCGNACRHCPYQHKRVADDEKKMIFNSAFYVGIGEFQDG